MRRARPLLPADDAGAAVDVVAEDDLVRRAQLVALGVPSPRAALRVCLHALVARFKGPVS